MWILQLKLLGCLIHGVEWLKNRPQETEFLRMQGVSPKEAIARHVSWKERILKRFRIDGAKEDVSSTQVGAKKKR